MVWTEVNSLFPVGCLSGLENPSDRFVFLKNAFPARRRNAKPDFDAVKYYNNHRPLSIGWQMPCG